jgi:hypothetical protein
MRNKIRPISIILLLAIIGFMLAAVSCAGISPKTQAQLDQAAEKYEATTGITPAQTGGLLFKWFGDYNEAKAANTPPLAIPAQSAK